jgi:hypothetical protein
MQKHIYNKRKFNLRKKDYKNFDRDTDGSTQTRENSIHNARLYSSITTIDVKEGFVGRDYSKVENISWDEFDSIPDINEM